MSRARHLLVVDPVACDGHGICAELLPEMIDLDPWGYPIVDEAAVPRALERSARKAVSGCPRLARHLLAVPEVAPGRVRSR